MFSCRHTAIAKYFGDPAPLCEKSCDYCQNPAAVKKLSAEAKLGSAPSSSPKRHRVIMFTILCFVFWILLFFYASNLNLTLLFIFTYVMEIGIYIHHFNGSFSELAGYSYFFCFDSLLSENKSLVNNHSQSCYMQVPFLWPDQ